MKVNNYGKGNSSCWELEGEWRERGRDIEGGGHMGLRLGRVCLVNGYRMYIICMSCVLVVKV